MKSQQEKMCIGNMRLAHKFITNYRERLGFQGLFDLFSRQQSRENNIINLNFSYTFNRLNEKNKLIPFSAM